MRRFLPGLAAIALGAIAIAACTAGVAPSAVPSAGATPAPSHTASAAASAGVPAVGANAFAGQGRLAFVSSGRLYVLDGTTRGKPAVLHAVAAPAGAAQPAWSRDGDWLAFLVGPASPDGQVPTGTLWLARADGQDAGPVLANAGPFSWSPAADVLAAIVTTPASGRESLYEIRPGGTPHLVPGGGGAGRIAWSPDGRQLAFTGIQYGPGGFTASTLETIPAAGGKPVVRARSTKDALLLWGWWPFGGGLLAWADPQGSGSIAADGIPLISYPLAAGRPVTLATTLPRQPFVTTPPAVATGAIALVAGGDRVLWNGKTILVCGTSGGCGGFPAGIPGPVNLDPAWSPAGEPTLAFVHATADWPGDFSQQNLAAWYATRRLWVYSLGGNPLRISGAGTGVADPVWSADGDLVLYVRDDGLWLISPAGGKPDSSPGLPSRTGGPALRIVSKLFAGAWPNYYGYVDWQDQFAWYS